MTTIKMIMTRRPPPPAAAYMMIILSSSVSFICFSVLVVDVSEDESVDVSVAAAELTEDELIVVVCLSGGLRERARADVTAGFVVVIGKRS